MSIVLQPSIGLKAAIEQRRAALAFKPDPIPLALLEEIFRLGIRAPSGYNLQPWRFMVLRSKASKEKLRDCTFNQPQVIEAPIVLICCGDRAVANPDYVESVIALGQTHAAMPDQLAALTRTQVADLFQNHPSFGDLEVWVNRQTMLAVAHLMIVAKGYGVDSCPIEEFSADQVKAAFAIPETVDVCCLLCLGYAAEPYKQYAGRFEIEHVFFGEEYGMPVKV